MVPFTVDADVSLGRVYLDGTGDYRQKSGVPSGMTSPPSLVRRKLPARG